ncbi:cytochrome c oxidase assembly protein subunit 15 [Natronobacterium texcoconense]|uniref:Cytochrome c oxidase assembly protein subunit 15 n=1 Tax=Natronobacterium texcoconense TaxID=1095778 RepID=A0A1H1C844_NATTX|nr:cytochrome c oxidase assembly protein subunit 15 [Natronobacterium texcoconense]
MLVTATILLGVAAKATGSGLACEANWPQCDAGPYNLFPANLPSFYEWFHRFVAMFAGFAIIGSAVSAWRSPTVDRRVTALVVLGMILTPIQVVLGWQTVAQYTMDILSLHFWTAVLIFALFVIATVLVWEHRLQARHVTGALALGAVAVPLHVLFSPPVITELTEYSPTVQMIQYGVTLAVVAAAIVAPMIGRWHLEDDRLTGYLSGTGVLALVVVFLGRQTGMTFNAALDLFYVVTAGLLLVAFLAGIYLVRRTS